MPGKPVTFIGSESVKGIVVLSNNKNCGRGELEKGVKLIDKSDEFLLQVEVL